MSLSSSSNDNIGGDTQETTDDIVFVVIIEREFTYLLHKVYVDSRNQKKVIYLLSLGLSVSDTNDDPLFSFDSEPWFSTRAAAEGDVGSGWYWCQQRR
jgi:hypothetical protein